RSLAGLLKAGPGPAGGVGAERLEDAQRLRGIGYRSGNPSPGIGVGDDWQVGAEGDLDARTEQVAMGGAVTLAARADLRPEPRPPEAAEEWLHHRHHASPCQARLEVGRAIGAVLDPMAQNAGLSALGCFDSGNHRLDCGV